MQEKQKIYALIVQNGDLIVFEQPDFPEAGIQIPGGTLESGEQLNVAVLREAYEETGLTDLAIVQYLGKHERDMRDYGKPEYHHRHFFHLASKITIPARWQHSEQFPSDGPQNPIRFLLYRAPLNNLPKLIADLDIFVPGISIT